jgi:glycerophosphoryl diester phosphodiesterase
LRKLPGILAIATLRVLLYLATLAPFVVAGALYWDRRLARFDLNFLVQTQPPEFWTGAVVLGGLAVAATATLLVVHIHLVFSLPCYLFEGRGALASLVRGFRVSRGAAWNLFRLLGTWLAFCLVVEVATHAALGALGGEAASLAGANLNGLIAVLALRAAVEITLQALLAVAGPVIHAGIVVRCFVAAGGTLERLLPARDAGRGASDRAGLRTRWIWLLPAIAVGIAVVAGEEIVERLATEDAVTITAHRGSSARAPENSLSAIRFAGEDGADYAEIDVQETADGVPVLLHDTDLARIAGLDRKIWEVTHDELAGLDAGSWFSEVFAGERIATLREAIEAARGRVKLNVEIKLNGHERDLVRRVVDDIRSAGFQSECIVTSLDYGALRQVRELAPEIETGYIIYQALGKMSRFDVEHLVVRAAMVDRVTLGVADRAGKRLHVWTVNDPAEMNALIDLGVHGILTDHPERLVKLLKDRAELNDVERLLLRLHNDVER